MKHLVVAVCLLLTGVMAAGSVAAQDAEPVVEIEFEGRLLRLTASEAVNETQQVAIWTQLSGARDAALRVGERTFLAAGADCDVLSQAGVHRHDDCTGAAWFRETGSCRPCLQDGVPAECCHECLCCATEQGEQCAYCGWWATPADADAAPVAGT